MDNCCVPFGCSNQEYVSKADLDRFTDKIENVLNEEKGRKLFRNFMITSKLRDGLKTLDLWEDTELLLKYKDNAEGVTYEKFLDELEKVIDKAGRVEDIDFATMERLTIASESKNKESIFKELQLLKIETSKALKNEYNAFRRHYVNYSQ